MIDSLTRNWWIQLIRGALAFGLGATALLAPSTGMTLATFLVAAFAIGDGAMTVTTGLALPDEYRGRSGLLAAGAGFIVLGLLVLFWPGLSATALTLLFAAWLVASGALVAYGARTLRPEISDSRIMGALGAVLIALGGLRDRRLRYAADIEAITGPGSLLRRVDSGSGSWVDAAMLEHLSDAGPLGLVPLRPGGADVLTARLDAMTKSHQVVALPPTDTAGDVAFPRDDW